MRQPLFTLMVVLVAFGLFAAPDVARADPTLTKATIQFHTGSDDKDKDTKLSVWVTVGSSAAAKLVGFANDKRFAENSSSEVFELSNVDPSTKKSEAAKGIKTRLLMEPKDGGDDNWFFKWTVTLEFKDGSSLAYYPGTK